MTRKQIEEKYDVVVLEKRYCVRTGCKGWAYSIYSDYYNAHFECDTPSATLKELAEYLSHEKVYI